MIFSQCHVDSRSPTTSRISFWRGARWMDVQFLTTTWRKLTTSTFPYFPPSMCNTWRYNYYHSLFVLDFGSTHSPKKQKYPTRKQKQLLNVASNNSLWNVVEWRSLILLLSRISSREWTVGKLTSLWAQFNKRQLLARTNWQCRQQFELQFCVGVYLELDFQFTLTFIYLCFHFTTEWVIFK